MRRLHVPRYVGGRSFIPPTQTETTTWRGAVVTNGGTVSDARAAVVNDFIYAEKQAGTWALTDDYWPLWAENAVQSLTSLKQLRLATAVAAPVFTADRGYTFNGTTSYINTNFVPPTHAVVMTGTDLRIGVYQTDGNTGGHNAGTGTGATVNLYLVTQALVTTIAANSPSVAFNHVSTLAFGFASGSRAGGGTTVRAFRNGAALPTVETVPTFSVLTGMLAPFIGARNASGAPGSPSNRSIGFMCVGAPLSNAQETAQYSNIQAWATAVGAQV